MKQPGMLSLGLLLLAGCASTPGPMVENGYPTGSLALAAIERGDWTTAERLLNDERRMAADDPARLVNLGRVYMATGRQAEAVAAWERALQAAPVEVETLGGRVATTDQLAREALDHYARTRTAAR
jgi:hypothetical protein